MPNRFLYYIDKFLSLFDISWLVATKPKEPLYEIGPYEIGPYEPLLEPKN